VAVRFTGPAAAKPADLRPDGRLSDRDTPALDRPLEDRPRMFSMTTLRFDDRSPDARTLELCIVPYNISTQAADGADSNPYRELFRHGAFREQVEEAQSTPLRIWLSLEHRKGVDHVIGHAVQLRDLPAGLYGAFRVHEGVLAGVSLRATPLPSRTLDGVTARPETPRENEGAARWPPLLPMQGNRRDASTNLLLPSQSCLAHLEPTSPQAGEK
jgi:hypothetical protein